MPQRLPWAEVVETIEPSRAGLLSSRLTLRGSTPAHVPCSAKGSASTSAAPKKGRVGASPTPPFYEGSTGESQRGVPQQVEKSAWPSSLECWGTLRPPTPTLECIEAPPVGSFSVSRSPSPPPHRHPGTNSTARSPPLSSVPEGVGGPTPLPATTSSWSRTPSPHHFSSFFLVPSKKRCAAPIAPRPHDDDDDDHHHHHLANNATGQPHSALRPKRERVLATPSRSSVSVSKAAPRTAATTTTRTTGDHTTRPAPLDESSETCRGAATEPPPLSFMAHYRALSAWCEDPVLLDAPTRAKQPADPTTPQTVVPAAKRGKGTTERCRAVPRRVCTHWQAVAPHADRRFRGGALALFWMVAQGLQRASLTLPTTASSHGGEEEEEDALLCVYALQPLFSSVLLRIAEWMVQRCPPPSPSTEDTGEPPHESPFSAVPAHYEEEEEDHEASRRGQRDPLTALVRCLEHQLLPCYPQRAREEEEEEEKEDPLRPENPLPTTSAPPPPPCREPAEGSAPSLGRPLAVAWRETVRWAQRHDERSLPEAHATTRGAVVEGRCVALLSCLLMSWWRCCAPSLLHRTAPASSRLSPCASVGAEWSTFLEVGMALQTGWTTLLRMRRTGVARRRDDDDDDYTEQDGAPAASLWCESAKPLLEEQDGKRQRYEGRRLWNVDPSLAHILIAWLHVLWRWLPQRMASNPPPARPAAAGDPPSASIPSLPAQHQEAVPPPHHPPQEGEPPGRSDTYTICLVVHFLLEDMSLQLEQATTLPSDDDAVLLGSHTSRTPSHHVPEPFPSLVSPPSKKDTTTTTTTTGASNSSIGWTSSSAGTSMRRPTTRANPFLRGIGFLEELLEAIFYYDYSESHGSTQHPGVVPARLSFFSFPPLALLWQRQLRSRLLQHVFAHLRQRVLVFQEGLGRRYCQHVSEKVSSPPEEDSSAFFVGTTAREIERNAAVPSRSHPSSSTRSETASAVVQSRRTPPARQQQQQQQPQQREKEEVSRRTATNAKASSKTAAPLLRRRRTVNRLSSPPIASGCVAAAPGERDAAEAPPQENSRCVGSLPWLAVCIQQTRDALLEHHHRLSSASSLSSSGWEQKKTEGFQGDATTSSDAASGSSRCTEAVSPDVVRRYAAEEAAALLVDMGVWDDCVTGAAQKAFQRYTTTVKMQHLERGGEEEMSNHHPTTVGSTETTSCRKGRVNGIRTPPPLAASMKTATPPPPFMATSASAPREPTPPPRPAVRSCFTTTTLETDPCVSSYYGFTEREQQVLLPGLLSLCLEWGGGELSASSFSAPVEGTAHFSPQTTSSSAAGASLLDRSPVLQRMQRWLVERHPVWTTTTTTTTRCHSPPLPGEGESKRDHPVSLCARRRMPSSSSSWSAEEGLPNERNGASLCARHSPHIPPPPRCHAHAQPLCSSCICLAANHHPSIGYHADADLIPFLLLRGTPLPLLPRKGGGGKPDVSGSRTCADDTIDEGGVVEIVWRSPRRRHIPPPAAAAAAVTEHQAEAEAPSIGTERKRGGGPPIGGAKGLLCEKESEVCVSSSSGAPLAKRRVRHCSSLSSSRRCCGSGSDPSTDATRTELYAHLYFDLEATKQRTLNLLLRDPEAFRTPIPSGGVAEDALLPPSLCVHTLRLRALVEVLLLHPGRKTTAAREPMTSSRRRKEDQDEEEVEVAEVWGEASSCSPFGQIPFLHALLSVAEEATAAAAPSQDGATSSASRNDDDDDNDGDDNDDDDDELPDEDECCHWVPLSEFRPSLLRAIRSDRVGTQSLWIGLYQLFSLLLHTHHQFTWCEAYLQFWTEVVCRTATTTTSRPSPSPLFYELWLRCWWEYAKEVHTVMGRCLPTLPASRGVEGSSAAVVASPLGWWDWLRIELDPLFAHHDSEGEEQEERLRLPLTTTTTTMTARTPFTTREEGGTQDQREGWWDRCHHRRVELFQHTLLALQLQTRTGAPPRPSSESASSSPSQRAVAARSTGAEEEIRLREHDETSILPAIKGVLSRPRQNFQPERPDPLATATSRFQERRHHTTYTATPRWCAAIPRTARGVVVELALSPCQQFMWVTRYPVSALLRTFDDRPAPTEVEERNCSWKMRAALPVGPALRQCVERFATLRRANRQQLRHGCSAATTLDVTNAKDSGSTRERRATGGEAVPSNAPSNAAHASSTAASAVRSKWTHKWKKLQWWRDRLTLEKSMQDAVQAIAKECWTLPPMDPPCWRMSSSLSGADDFALSGGGAAPATSRRGVALEKPQMVHVRGTPELQREGKRSGRPLSAAAVFAAASHAPHLWLAGPPTSSRLCQRLRDVSEALLQHWFSASTAHAIPATNNDQEEERSEKECHVMSIPPAPARRPPSSSDAAPRCSPMPARRAVLSFLAPDAAKQSNPEAVPAPIPSHGKFGAAEKRRAGSSSGEATATTTLLQEDSHLWRRMSGEDVDHEEALLFWRGVREWMVELLYGIPFLFRYAQQYQAAQAGGASTPRTRRRANNPRQGGTFPFKDGAEPPPEDKEEDNEEDVDDEEEWETACAVLDLAAAPGADETLFNASPLRAAALAPPPNMETNDEATDTSSSREESSRPSRRATTLNVDSAEEAIADDPLRGAGLSSITAPRTTVRCSDSTAALYAWLTTIISRRGRQLRRSFQRDAFSEEALERDILSRFWEKEKEEEEEDRGLPRPAQLAEVQQSERADQMRPNGKAERSIADTRTACSPSPSTQTNAAVGPRSPNEQRCAELSWVFIAALYRTIGLYQPEGSTKASIETSSDSPTNPSAPSDNVRPEGADETTTAVPPWKQLQQVLERELEVRARSMDAFVRQGPAHSSAVHETGVDGTLTTTPRGNGNATVAGTTDRWLAEAFEAMARHRDGNPTRVGGGSDTLEYPSCAQEEEEERRKAARDAAPPLSRRRQHVFLCLSGGGSGGVPPSAWPSSRPEPFLSVLQGLREIPWECVGLLRSQSVSRIPSRHWLQETLGVLHRTFLPITTNHPAATPNRPRRRRRSTSPSLTASRCDTRRNQKKSRVEGLAQPKRWASPPAAVSAGCAPLHDGQADDPPSTPPAFARSSSSVSVVTPRDGPPPPSVRRTGSRGGAVPQSPSTKLETLSPLPLFERTFVVVDPNATRLAPLLRERFVSTPALVPIAPGAETAAVVDGRPISRCGGPSERPLSHGSESPFFSSPTRSGIVCDTSDVAKHLERHAVKLSGGVCADLWRYLRCGGERGVQRSSSASPTPSSHSLPPTSPKWWWRRSRGGGEPFTAYVYVGHKAGEALLSRETLMRTIPAAAVTDCRETLEKSNSSSSSRAASRDPDHEMVSPSIGGTEARAFVVRRRKEEERKADEEEGVDADCEVLRSPEEEEVELRGVEKEPGPPPGDRTTATTTTTTMTTTRTPLTNACAASLSVMRWSRYPFSAPVVLLIGCSSASSASCCLESPPATVGMAPLNLPRSSLWLHPFEALGGLPERYLSAGSPAFVGCLWDVTARDVDQLLRHWVDPSMRAPAAATTSRLSSSLGWEGAPRGRPSLGEAVGEGRLHCKLALLTGGATILYGLPDFTV